mgnify:CR=1 FL=1
MQYIKNSVFLYLTPRQRSQLVSFLRSFAKKHPKMNANELLDKFIEEENYYNDVGSAHFEFALENFSNDEFLSDIKKFFEYIFWELKQKEAQKPLIERQKALQKEARKRANDFKMSKLKPTKKQLWYYEKVAKAHNVPQKPLEGATRLDLRNWIMEIIEPKTQGEEDFDE